jgi:hypothetical protein
VPPALGDIGTTVRLAAVDEVVVAERAGREPPQAARTIATTPASEHTTERRIRHIPETPTDPLAWLKNTACRTRDASDTPADDLEHELSTDAALD